MRKVDVDPSKRMVSKDVENEFSPMDPPDAYRPPSVDAVPRAEMALFLQQLMDDHERLTTHLDAFETVLNQIAENGVTREADEQLRDFFHAFDEEVIRHERNEERELFPLLDRKLRENGEHSPGPDVFTSVDVMQSEHLKVVQLAGVVFNFFGLSVRLPDPASRAVVLDAAIEQGKELVETLRLHMFREDNIIFPLAHRYIDQVALDSMRRD